MKKFWTTREERWLRQMWSEHSVEYLADYFECTKNQVRSKAKRMKLPTMGDGRFVKGQTPWNKGLKGLNYGGRETQFTKGHQPHNTKHNGCISIRTDNRGMKQKFIRVALGKWEPLSRHVWRKHHGNIPAGYVVAFKNGNTMNCDISNLEMITRQEAIARIRLLDNYIISSLSMTPGRGKRDPRLKNFIKDYPELIEARRAQLMLNAKIKNNGTKQTKRSK